jgi:exo-beta-1,3-glucanase (GH17 family)
MVPYLTGVYAVPGAKRAFDAVAIHPYARDFSGVRGAVVRVRGVMRRAGDARTQLWITETGWASGGPVSARTRAFRTTEKGQARKLRTTVSSLLRLRRKYRIGLINWFSWRDRARRHRERDWWAIHTGLLRRSGKAKPSWRAYSRLARGG